MAGILFKPAFTVLQRHDNPAHIIDTEQIYFRHVNSGRQLNGPPLIERRRLVKFGGNIKMRVSKFYFKS